jgi:uncharacterized repeat protein (TIGR01451 family)
VSLSGSQSSVLNGQRVTYTVVAGNQGPDIALGANLVVNTDDLLDAPLPSAPPGWSAP